MIYYSYTIDCVDELGEPQYVSDMGFASYAEAADAMSEMWQAIEDDGDGLQPVGYSIDRN